MIIKEAAAKITHTRGESNETQYQRKTTGELTEKKRDIDRKSEGANEQKNKNKGEKKIIMEILEYMR